MLPVQSVSDFPVYAFLRIRFALSAIVLLTLFGQRVGELHPRMICAGIARGLCLLGACAFQTVGLQYSTASKAEFITGLSWG